MNCTKFQLPRFVLFKLGHKKKQRVKRQITSQSGRPTCEIWSYLSFQKMVFSLYFIYPSNLGIGNYKSTLSYRTNPHTCSRHPLISMGFL